MTTTSVTKELLVGDRHRFPRRSEAELREEDLQLRRRFAGRSDEGADGHRGPATRLPSGEWMQRIALDLPHDMRLALELRAEQGGVSEDQIIRGALAAAGIGDAGHVIGIRDGTCSG